MKTNPTMHHLKILEHTSIYLFVFVAIGTFISIWLTYIFFAKNWLYTLFICLSIDAGIFAIHFFTKNVEPRIIEINSLGVHTNRGLIRYGDIQSVSHEESYSLHGKAKFVLNYLVIKTNKQTHKFYTNGYKNGHDEILKCIHANIKICGTQVSE